MSETSGYSPESNEELRLSREVANILRGLGEDFGFDAETCDEIAAMPFDDAFEAAYGYLTQAGLEADEVLSGFLGEGPNADAVVSDNTMQGLEDGNAQSGDASN